MVDPTLSPRALRRIWSQLPPSTRQRLIAQLVFLLRATEPGAICEFDGHSVSASQPACHRVRAAIDPDAGGASSGEQLRQYQLTDRARAFGWPAQRCLVIDDDLGISGAQSSNRPGYQRLVSMLALREVGIVLGLEASRLARNCLDWYQLLELAAAFNVLIGDEDGLYDPSDFNDRLLLGLKGTLSEIERYQITARMQRGRLNKARRGEYAKRVPVGYAYDAVSGQLQLSPD